ncbi:MAG: hypothetical protein ACK58T_48810, partial [Phycisphaerae bacterium]
NSNVLSLTTLPDGSIVAGGVFTASGSTTTAYIARWNGASWQPVGSGTNSWVYAVKALSDGSLVAGGAFTTAGGGAAKYIARWNGASWAPVGSGMGHFVYLLTAQSGGSFVASGSFTTAGGIAANRIARWTGEPCAEPTVTQHPQAQTTLTSGETLMLSTTFRSATVNDTVAWHWHRNAIDITNGAGGASVGGGTVAGATGSPASPTPTDVTATLTITGVQPSYAGLFT